ncbi:MAG TPA: TlpA disulfide reductase family protein, partial [Bryobacterales bacterium]|nr:TlpA disulfide reductase family protein [Bryobacterales bacterium]
MKALPLLAALAALLPAQTSKLQTVKTDNYPLRAGCSESADEVARLKQGDAVKIRYALAGSERPCYAVTVEANGAKLQGYVWAEALTGLDEFEQARRAAAAATGVVIDHNEAPPASVGRQRQAARLPAQAGPPVPDFSFPALDSPAQHYDNDSLRGKTYLIDFWATWCGPCRAQMPHLHQLYAKYKYQGFEILSVSLDNAPADVARYRQGQWNMPWLHAFVSGAARTEAERRFQVQGIPTACLVDRDGRVVAVGAAVQGAYLEQLLQRTLSTYR